MPVADTQPSTPPGFTRFDISRRYSFSAEADTVKKMVDTRSETPETSLKSHQLATLLGSIQISETHCSDFAPGSASKITNDVIVMMALQFLSLKGCCSGFLVSRLFRDKLTLFIRDINLCGPVYGDTQLCGVQRLMSRCRNLETINLYAQNAQQRIMPFIQAIPSCQNLRSINLYGNGIGDQMAVALAAALPHCWRLREVDLRWNSITAYGANAIIAGIHASRLMRVDLRYNGITIEAKERFQQYLKQVVATHRDDIDVLL